MIKSRCGMVEITGDHHTILADLGVIVSTLHENGFSKEEINNSMEIGFKSIEELASESNNHIDKLFGNLMELLNEMRRDLKEDK